MQQADPQQTINALKLRLFDAQEQLRLAGSVMQMVLQVTGTKDTAELEQKLREAFPEKKTE